MNVKDVEQAEAIFAKFFATGMKGGDIASFKKSHYTLYNQVIIPSIIDVMMRREAQLKQIESMCSTFLGDRDISPSGKESFWRQFNAITGTNAGGGGNG